MTKVMVGYVYGGGLDAEFVHCLERLKLYDEKIGGGYLNHGEWKCANGGTSIPTQRNNIVQTFLGTDCDWLWFVDTDETFDPDIIERFIKSSDAVERPIVSGLVMAYRPKHKPTPVEPACAQLDENNILRTVRNIPAGNPWEVAAVGAGCLFVHRTVYEAILKSAGDTAFPWFQNVSWHRPDKDGNPVVAAMGEDYTFSLRAGHEGFPILVDTDIQCGHRKVYEFTAQDFWAQVPFEIVEPRTYVIIPVKDQKTLTESLLKQLEKQGGYHGIIVLDNGSGKETRRYLERQTIAEVIPMPGVGIHAMWNFGAALALSRWPKVNLAILNNDLNLGPDFLTTLSTELRSAEDIVAVSPNYDGREMDGPVDCEQICANRYDGTGGAPGFAFMVKGELFQAGYAYPEDAMWWFGDNDMLLAIRSGGGRWILTPKTTVEHVHGGGQTGDWDKYSQSPQYQKDRQAFVARWAS